MKIKKVKETVGVVGNVANERNDSTKDTYSCDYINKLQDYSTEEQVIGTWIDGKPLYRRIISASIPTTETDGTMVSSEVTHNIENMDIYYIKNSFFIDNQETSFQIPTITMAPTTTNKVRVDLTKSVLRTYNNVSYWGGFTLYAVVEYTKATD